MVLRRDLAGERSRPSLPSIDTHEGADDCEIYPRFSFSWRPEVRLRSLGRKVQFRRVWHLLNACPLQSRQLHLAWSMVLVAIARSLHGGYSAHSATSGIFNVHSEDIDILPRTSERARRGCGLWSPIRSTVGSCGIFPAITVVRLSIITRHLEGGASEDLPLASVSSSLSSRSFPLSRPRE